MDQAEAAYNKALAIDPQYADALNNLGAVFHAREDLEEAEKCYRRGLLVKPQSADLLIKVGHVLRDTAIRELCKTGGHSDSGLEKWKEALIQAETVLANAPDNTAVMALKNTALYGLGRFDEWQAHSDFDNLIETYTITSPDGYADMDAFNDELLDICQNHPAAKDYEQSMTMGQRIYNLHKGEDLKAYSPLVDFAYEAFHRYCDARPTDPDHPFLSQKPDNCFIDMWGSIVGQDGSLQSHIHPQGWLSGVYYAHVPEAAETAKDRCEGWIEFGRPPKYPSEQGNVPFPRVQPVVGLMVFFPSYYFHQTIPFGTDETRFSIAFDFISED